MQSGHWIFAATRMELNSVWNARYPELPLPEKPWRIIKVGDFAYTQLECWCVDPNGPWFSITGPGMPQSLMRGMIGVMELKPKAIWQLGIAGAYPQSDLKLGQTVWVAEECIGDLGLEIPPIHAGTLPSFRSMHQESWAEGDVCGLWPLANPIHDLGLNALQWRSARGLTVNTVTGIESMGRLRHEMWSADVETMEGAAAALIGRHYGLPVYQIRTISNWASTRTLTPKAIAEAISQLQHSVAAMVLLLSKDQTP